MYRPVYAYYARQDSAFTIIVVNWKSRASDFSIFLTLFYLLSLLLALCHQLCLIHLYHVFV